MSVCVSLSLSLPLSLSLSPSLSFSLLSLTPHTYTRSNLELLSLHTVSKGAYGECGLRGGYMEMHNVSPAVVDEMYVYVYMCICMHVHACVCMCTSLCLSYLSVSVPHINPLSPLFIYTGTRSQPSTYARTCPGK